MRLKSYYVFLTRYDREHIAEGNWDIKGIIKCAAERLRSDHEHNARAILEWLNKTVPMYEYKLYGVHEVLEEVN